MLFRIKATVQVKKKKGKTKNPFNPLTYDSANLLALYDGDFNLAPATWMDRSANGYDLTLFNNPPNINNAINGHSAVRFDGINQYGQTAAFGRNQPQTVYIVFNIIAGLNARVYDGLAADSMIIWDLGGGNISAYAGVNLAQVNNNNVYNVYCFVYNGVNSENRINNAASLVGNAGANNASGLTISARAGGTVPANCEIAYVILRQGADNTATQNLFINFLKNRFAL